MYKKIQVMAIATEVATNDDPLLHGARQLEENSRFCCRECTFTCCTSRCANNLVENIL